MAGPVVRTSASGGAVRQGANARLDPHSRVVEHSAVAALVVVDQALANLPHSLLDALGGALNLNDALRGLGEHFLLGDHAYAGGILDLLDLQALPTNDGAHLVVGDQEADGCAS